MPLSTLWWTQPLWPNKRAAYPSRRRESWARSEIPRLSTMRGSAGYESHGELYRCAGFHRDPLLELEDATVRRVAREKARAAGGPAIVTWPTSNQIKRRPSMIDTTELEEVLAKFATERDWEQSHTPRNLALALVGEVGESCELLQWKSDENVTAALEKPAFVEALSDELADVLISLVRLASVAGVDLEKAVTRKIEKNAER